MATVLNRAHDRRKDENYIGRRLEAEDSCFVAVWQTKVLVTEDEDRPRAVLLPRSRIRSAMAEGEEVYFLGEENGRGVFAVNLATADGVPPQGLESFGGFQDLRSVGPLLSQRDGALLAYAKTIVYWHSRNHFCSVCGSPSGSGEGGHLRTCSNPACGALHFPRTDPAIIVLVRSGEKCLLGRQPVWPARRYSVIAGFVEPGESAEAAVVREVFEEAGVRVGSVCYQSSQPWPFPCSLMLGFTAEAENEDIRLGDRELEDARWFTREQLRAAVEEGTVLLPTRISVAYRLVEGWFDAQGSVRMRDLAAPGG